MTVRLWVRSPPPFPRFYITEETHEKRTGSKIRSEPCLVIWLLEQARSLNLSFIVTTF